MFLEDIAQGRTIEIALGQHKKYDEKHLAMERQIKMESAETGNVSVEMAYSRVEIDVPKNTPFSVSPRYQVK